MEQTVNKLPQKFQVVSVARKVRPDTGLQKRCKRERRYPISRKKTEIHRFRQNTGSKGSRKGLSKSRFLCLPAKFAIASLLSM
jgi:hypothetical protein